MKSVSSRELASRVSGCCVVIERAGVAPELHEDFLQHVLGRAGIGENPQGDRINNRRITVIKARHGSLVAGADRRYRGDRFAIA